MRRVAVILSAAVIAVCSLVQAAAAQDRDNRFLPAKSWAFQLVNLGEAEQKRIADSTFDLVVIDSEFHDPDKGWQDGRPMSRPEIERMQSKPDGSKRLVIAYFSIGEAEDYRKYWQADWNKKKPAWIGKETKEWKHNYHVQYWDPAWQDIVMKFADQVIDSGFDGFYIDRADAYYTFGDSKLARDRMEAFVLKLTAHIRSRKPDAAILMQNAEELLDRPAYVAAIDGVAKEDLLYGITHREEPNKRDEVEWSTNLLKAFQVKGKKVFVIEYLTRKDYVADAKRRLDALGFVMYMGPRGLAELNLDAADIDNYKGPRPDALKPATASPALGEAAPTLVTKAKKAIAKSVTSTKEAAKAASDKVKATFKPAEPKKAN